jgi:hypothetical protein
MPHLRPFRPGSRVAGLLVMASAVFGCLAVSVARAEDAPSATPAQNPPPAGLRILYSGDSWHRFMPGLMPRVAAAAGITGQSAAWSGKPDEIKELLTGGKIDVMSWGRPGWSDGQFNQTLGDEFATAGLAGNPNFRFYLQMAWKVHDGLGGKKKIETVADYDESNLDEVQAVIDNSRKTVEAWADAINKKHGKPVFFLVPVGDAVTQLRRMIVAGKVPGVTQQSAVWSDAMPHAGPLAGELAGYCNYAAVYRRSPEGLDVKDSVPAEQRAILQKLAWDTVSKYPYAGVATDPLAGWKESGDLPADTVVTDYNEYIEALPAAERPGVANVKYYTDDTGRTGVLVIVFVNREPWNHFLVYDKDQRRTGVTKQPAAPASK